MPWLATAPDISIPDLALQPVAALVRGYAEAENDGARLTNAAGKFRDIVIDAEEKTAAQRLDVQSRTLHAIGRITAARLDGWSIDCSVLIARFHEEMISAEKVRAEMSSAVRRFTRATQRHKVPGANIVGTWAQRADALMVVWLNELEDYKSMLENLQKVMEREQSTSPIGRSIKAYSDAVLSVTGSEQVGETEIDPEDYEAMATIKVPMSDKVRGDRDAKYRLLSRIHDEVSAVDISLVGLVALQIVDASQNEGVNA